MSVSALSPSRALGGVSGLLPVVLLLGLVLVLLTAAQLYLRRQWLLKALHHFPSPPSHWFYGHKREVGWSWMGEWEGWEGRRSRAWSHSASSYLALWLPESTDVQSDGSAPGGSLCVGTTDRSLRRCQVTGKEAYLQGWVTSGMETNWLGPFRLRDFLVL